MSATYRLWDIVDGIHECLGLFNNESSAYIICFVGAVESVLIWTKKMSICDAKVHCFGPTKLFCGREMKHQSNTTSVCDSQRKFMTVKKFSFQVSDYYDSEDSYDKKK